MIRRIGLSLLWFFAAWTTAAMVAFVLTLPAWIVPVIALTAAVAVLRPIGDIRRAIAIRGRRQALAAR